MAEVVVIKERNGVYPGVGTALTNITGRFCTIDAAQPGTTNPCKVPTVGFYYSYWKTIYADVSGTGWTSIRDFYWYCDGTTAVDWGLDPSGGGMMMIGHRDDGDTTGHGMPLSAYMQAIGDPGVTGFAIGAADPNGHTYYNGQVTPAADADDHDANNALLIDPTIYLFATTPTFQSKAWILQLKIPPTASHGELTQKTHTITYQVY